MRRPRGSVVREVIRGLLGREEPLTLAPIKVVDLELSCPLLDLDGLSGYVSVLGLVRLRGTPVGYIAVPVAHSRCTAQALAEAMVRKHGEELLCEFPSGALTSPPIAEWLPIGSPSESRRRGALPTMTVAVCTRDRPDELARCLHAVTELDYPAPLDIIVVDNARGSHATERLVRERFPGVRYEREPRPGLDRARNHAIRTARGELIAFTDDDALPDRGWALALGRVFAEDADVMAVTGLVVPYELETEAQVLFERCGGFGRGFSRRQYRVDIEGGERAARRHGNTGKFGTGANMAFRRSVFERIGPFDPALDVGTVTNGGGDLEMFFRVLKTGHTLVYEPRAVVRHRHRREYGELRTQLMNWGIGMSSYMARSWLAYPEERLALTWVALRLLVLWHLRRLAVPLIRRRIPRELVWAELQGTVAGLTRYQRARERAAAADP